MAHSMATYYEKVNMDNPMAYELPLYIVNVAAMLFHFGLAVAAVITGSRNGGMSTPRLSLYLSETTWDNNTATIDSSVRFDFSPSYRKLENGLPLTWITVGFFAVSAMAHAVVVVNGPPRNTRNSCRFCYDYYSYIESCQNPLRWIEYSFSASLMMLGLAYTSGIRDVYLLITLTVLCFTTMIFGWVTERFSSVHEGEDGKSCYVKPFRARIFPHLLGYIPFTCIWFVLFHSFYHNTSDLESEMPEFVYVLVHVQMVIFSCFALVQLIQQYSSPMNYWKGEVAYCVLSIVAKCYLGGTLIANLFLVSS